MDAERLMPGERFGIIGRRKRLLAAGALAALAAAPAWCAALEVADEFMLRQNASSTLTPAAADAGDGTYPASAPQPYFWFDANDTTGWVFTNYSDNASCVHTVPSKAGSKLAGTRWLSTDVTVASSASAGDGDEWWPARVSHGRRDARRRALPRLPHVRIAPRARVQLRDGGRVHGGVELAQAHRHGHRRLRLAERRRLVPRRRRRGLLHPLAPRADREDGVGRLQREVLHEHRDARDGQQLGALRRAPPRRPADVAMDGRLQRRLGGALLDLHVGGRHGARPRHRRRAPGDVVALRHRGGRRGRLAHLAARVIDEREQQGVRRRRDDRARRRSGREPGGRVARRRPRPAGHGPQDGRGAAPPRRDRRLGRRARPRGRHARLSRASAGAGRRRASARLLRALRRLRRGVPERLPRRRRRHALVQRPLEPRLDGGERKGVLPALLCVLPQRGAEGLSLPGAQRDRPRGHDPVRRPVPPVHDRGAVRHGNEHHGKALAVGRDDDGRRLPRAWHGAEPRGREGVRAEVACDVQRLAQRGDPPDERVRRCAASRADGRRRVRERAEGRSGGTAPLAGLPGGGRPDARGRHHALRHQFRRAVPRRSAARRALPLPQAAERDGDPGRLRLPPPEVARANGAGLRRGGRRRGAGGRRAVRRRERGDGDRRERRALGALRRARRS